MAMNNTNSKLQLQSLINNSFAIRQEIQRFESVHPSIYAIYDLIELIQDVQIAQQIRDHVVSIEDSFVNSQEWTISRAVPDLRLGIVGSLNSGKSALVHRYLTGSYMQEESPEGGRFKKEIQIDNQSYLLLIRDEGGPPEMQFAAWVDAVIFVFSLENEASFNAIYTYYSKMIHYRNSADIPMILVGTQDAISERSPRVIDDSRARKLANDLKKCAYYESCSTYGYNVEKIFHEACQKIVQNRLLNPTSTPTNSRPTTPQGGSKLGVPQFHHQPNTGSGQHISSPTNGFSTSSCSPASGITTNTLSPNHMPNFQAANNSLSQRQLQPSSSLLQSNNKINLDFINAEQQNSVLKWNAVGSNNAPNQITITTENNNTQKISSSNNIPPNSLDNLHPLGVITSLSAKDKEKDLHTPTSTPTTSRKSRRRSNLFIPSSKKNDEKFKNSELGSGRAIPLKQGYLYKRSSKSLNKEWKKKYVTLCDDGRLTYHPSLHDYMDDVHGKEIPLQYVTVKIPGQKPRGSKSIITNSALTNINQNIFNNNVNSNCNTSFITEGISGISLLKDKKLNDKISLTDSLKEAGKTNSQTSGDEGIALSNSNSQSVIGSDSNNKTESQTPNIKKRHRRMKSNGVKSNDMDDSDGFEFYIVSLDNKQWHFEASNSEERDEWVYVIEQEIFKSLQCIESSKSKEQNPNDIASMQSIRTKVAGNQLCADCDAINPEWASLNLGILVCIECSGIHRNLGTHISKVRSLGLDEWPPGHLSVMLALGNHLANSVWECNTRGYIKPSSTSSREEKEKWIKMKYESKEFLPPYNSNTSLGQQLIESVVKSDMKSVILLLAHSSNEHINCTVNSRDLRTPLHFACAIGNLAIAQLLIWHNANLKQNDHEGRTCLTYAKAANSLAIVKQSNGKPHHVTAETTTALVNLLESLGCVDPHPLTGGINNVGSHTGSFGTLSRRRETIGTGATSFEKVPSSVV